MGWEGGGTINNEEERFAGRGLVPHGQLARTR